MFETEWLLTAPIEEVFELASYPESYSSWWPGVKESTLLDPGDERGLGRTGAYIIQSPLGYKMRFETKAIEVSCPNRVVTGVRRDLIGTGTHYLETRESGIYVRFHWYVSTTKGSPLRLVQRVRRMAKAWGGRLITATAKLVESPTPLPVPQQ